MENTFTTKEKADVAIGIVPAWVELYDKIPFYLPALRPLFACLIVFLFAPTESPAEDSVENPHQRYRVVVTSPVPNPKESPYPDCLIHILCQPITKTGSPAGMEVDLVFFAFRNRVLYPAAKLKHNDEVSVVTIPYQEASERIRKSKQINDLPSPKVFDVQVLYVSQWDLQDKFVSNLTATKATPSTPTSNRDLIIQTLIAHQGRITGGMNRDFFFWTHIPAMYETDFWKIQPTRKNALGPLKSILLFKQHLDEKNIDLVFVPIPRSPTIYPAIATNIEYDPEIDGRINFAVRDLMDSLEAGGVTCVDLTPPFLANAYQEFDGRSYPIYRRNNTHWAPSGVRMAASIIADTIKKRSSFNNLATRDPSASFTENVSLEELPYTMPNFGRLPSRRQPSEMQPIYRINSLNQSGAELLKHNLPNAEIHLLGDSFTNAYDSGTGQAGLHSHLVNALKTPINRIASASGGSGISPNQFARQANLSKSKIVIWTVCESFIAAPDIWSNIPLDRPYTLMLDKLLSQATLSHDAFAFHLASSKTKGSYIAIGDSSSPDSLAEESHILWKGIRIADEKMSPSFTTYTWIKKSGSVSSDIPPEKHPLSWEIWINGSLYKTQKTPTDRGIFRYRRWEVSLNKFAGQTLDVKLVCRRVDPSQSLPGQPCWILPKIHGAILDISSSNHHNPEAKTTTRFASEPAAQTATAAPISHTYIIWASILLSGIGIATTCTLRRRNKRLGKVPGNTKLNTP